MTAASGDSGSGEVLGATATPARSSERGVRMYASTCRGSGLFRPFRTAVAADSSADKLSVGFDGLAWSEIPAVRTS